jgi:hypothetical protein
MQSNDRKPNLYNEPSEPSPLSWTESKSVEFGKVKPKVPEKKSFLQEKLQDRLEEVKRTDSSMSFSSQTPGSPLTPSSEISLDFSQKIEKLDIDTHPTESALAPKLNVPIFSPSTSTYHDDIFLTSPTAPAPKIEGSVSQTDSNSSSFVKVVESNNQEKPSFDSPSVTIRKDPLLAKLRNPNSAEATRTTTASSPSNGGGSQSNLNASSPNVASIPPTVPPPSGPSNSITVS